VLGDAIDEAVGAALSEEYATRRTRISS
jgi:hypothetical protein